MGCSNVARATSQLTLLTVTSPKPARAPAMLAVHSRRLSRCVSARPDQQARERQLEASMGCSNVASATSQLTLLTVTEV